MNIVIEKNIWVPMRDDVKLATDVYRPEYTEPLPCIIRRLPYNKESSKYISSPEILQLVQKGYVYIIQDVRGTASSEGEFEPFSKETEDGADLIQWVINQRWSNGKVGLIGRSYHGATQFYSAQMQPKGLQAMVTEVTPSDAYDGLTYQGGAFRLAGSLMWAARMFNNTVLRKYKTGGKELPSQIKEYLNKDGEPPVDFNFLPLINTPLSKMWPVYKSWIEHPSYDEFWEKRSIREQYGKVTVPVLHIGGWYDMFLRGTLENYQGVKEQGGSELARKNQRLIVGPWSHRNRNGVFLERHYGKKANRDSMITQLHIDYYDHWLKGKESKFEQAKPVKIFVMGIDEWRDEEDWPLPDTVFQPYYLKSNGKANTANGDGVLSTEKPEKEPVDMYMYNPNNPVPTVGGSLHQLPCKVPTDDGEVTIPGEQSSGPIDQQFVERREDVLCYTTDPFVEPVEVTGPIKLVLYASSSARDTDFTGKLVDVHPNGRAELLTEGILRARYRNSTSSPELLEPEKVYELHIDLGATSNVFKAGHRIRLEISSSNFPLYDRNSNTGGIIAEESAEDFIIAENKIFHDSFHPSHLILPIIKGRMT